MTQDSTREELLHIAVCQAVTLLNVGDMRPANSILRQALNDYADMALRSADTAELADKLIVLTRRLKELQVLSAMGPWMACQRGSDSPYLFGHNGEPIATWLWKKHPDSATETLMAEHEAYCSLEFIAEFKNSWRELWTLIEKAVTALRSLKAPADTTELVEASRVINMLDGRERSQREWGKVVNDAIADQLQDAKYEVIAMAAALRRTVEPADTTELVDLLRRLDQAGSVGADLSPGDPLAREAAAALRGRTGVNIERRTTW